MDKTICVVFVNNKQEILALKRSFYKEWYPNKWDVISGKVQENETPEDCLKREIKEEIGVSDFEVIKKAKPHIYGEFEKEWLVHPFLCKIKNGSIILNKEHQEYKWMKLKELLESDYAPPLKIDLTYLFDIF